MCHYITAVLPTTDSDAGLGGLVEKHRLLFERVSNDSVSAQLRPGERQLRATGHMCDCGTGLGAGRRAPAESDLDRRVAKLQKKGWGEAKIARWLDQQESNEHSRARKRAARSETPTAEEWHRFLVEVLGSGGVEWVGLLLHWYSGDLSEEQVRFARQPVSFSELSPQLLLDLKEDVLYEFRRASVA